MDVHVQQRLDEGAGWLAALYANTMNVSSAGDAFSAMCCCLGSLLFLCKTRVCRVYGWLQQQRSSVVWSRSGFDPDMDEGAGWLAGLYVNTMNGRSAGDAFSAMCCDFASPLPPCMTRIHQINGWLQQQRSGVIWFKRGRKRGLAGWHVPTP
jgi:hypothetical protein